MCVCVCVCVCFVLNPDVIWGMDLGGGSGVLVESLNFWGLNPDMGGGGEQWGGGGGGSWVLH